MNDYFYSLEEILYNSDLNTKFEWPVWMYTLLANENNM